MTTETQTQELDARKLWDQFDAEEVGSAVAPASTQQVDLNDGGAAQDAAPEAVKKSDSEGAATQSQDDEPVDSKKLRNQIAGLEAMVNQLTGRLRNAEGHIGGLTSQLKQQIEAAKVVKASGADAPSLNEIQAAQGSPEALRELEREYPEFAKALAPAIEASLKAHLKGFEDRLPKAPTGDSPAPLTRADLDAATQRLEGELAIEQRHPGWKAEVKKAEFVGFVQGGAPEIRLLASSNDPADAIRLLDIYRESTKKAPPDPREEQRKSSINAAASLPSGRGSTNMVAKPVDDMSPQEYWRYLDQLEKQQAKA